MKDAEDEAFDDLARRQGGGFPAKRKMAADKLHWSDCAVHNGPAYPAGPCDCGVAQEPLIDRLRKTASKGVSVWGDLMLEAADALAQPAQEPVAWISPKGNIHFDPYQDSVPLYTAPPQREWVGLTDEELEKIWYDMKHLIGWYSFQESARATEAKLKERNS